VFRFDGVEDDVLLRECDGAAPDISDNSLLVVVEVGDREWQGRRSVMITLAIYNLEMRAAAVDICIRVQESSGMVLDQ
jgi:hypothetical protein